MKIAGPVPLVALESGYIHMQLVSHATRELVGGRDDVADELGIWREACGCGCEDLGLGSLEREEFVPQGGSCLVFPLFLARLVPGDHYHDRLVPGDTTTPGGVLLREKNGPRLAIPGEQLPPDGVTG